MISSFTAATIYFTPLQTSSPFHQIQLLPITAFFTMSALQDLPIELFLHAICTQCPRPEIRSLRLTSRLFVTIADEHFLDDAVFFFAREDFERAETIVNNSRIAKNVRSITFHTDRVPWLGPKFGLWNELRRHRSAQRPQ